MVNEATQRMNIEATLKKTITANNVLITSKPGTWELQINYFKQHYRNERTAADNLKQPSLPIITQWVKMAKD